MVTATANKDEPPYEMNGNVIPFAGNRLTATPILMNACNATISAKPAPGELREAVAAPTPNATAAARSAGRTARR